MDKAILEYTNWGLSLIPIKYKDKKPAVDSWKRYQAERATDEEIKKWFNGGTPSNIAIVCGKISDGLVVLDYDKQALELFVQHNDFWLEKFGKKIDELTPLVQTGGGGYHVYLKVKLLPQLFHPVGEDRKNIPDIQSEGGYVLAPPSIHPSGNPYRRLNPQVKDIFHVGSLLDLGIKTPVAGQREQNEPGWVTKALEGVGEGERDNTCTKLAGYFRNVVPQDVTRAILLDFAKRCSPPLDEKTVFKCVNSTYRLYTAEVAIQTPLPCYNNLIGKVPTSFAPTAALRLAVQMWRQNMSREQAHSVLKIWNDYNLSDKQLDSTLATAYSGKLKLGCADIEAAGFCDPACPIWGKRYMERDVKVEAVADAIERLIKVKTDPPYYRVTVMGRQVNVSNDELFEIKQFQKCVMTSANFIPHIGMKSPEWHIYINKKLAEREEEEAPADSGAAVNITSLVYDWLQQTPKAINGADVRAGRPLERDETYYFRAKDALGYLKKQHRINILPHELWQILRSLGASLCTRRLGPEIFKLWSLPLNPAFIEESDVTSFEDDAESNTKVSEKVTNQKGGQKELNLSPELEI